MYDVQLTEEFESWMAALGDKTVRSRVQARLDRLGDGNPGDHKSVGRAVFEMRIDHGPGFRLYYTQVGAVMIVMLCGGDKSSQVRDIKRAVKMASDLQSG